jgi:hypothetical protein
MNLTALAVFAGALAPIMPVGAVLFLIALLAITVLALLRKGKRPRAASGTFVGRHRTRDISILAQSGIGIIGRITRSVPAPKILPGILDGTNPIASFGLAFLRTAQNTFRGILATDAGAAGISGIAVMPFPFQASSGTNYGATTMGGLTAVPAGVVDGNFSGAQTVYLNSAQAPTATMADKVHVWCAASSGTHVQGGFENVPSAAVASAAKAGGNTGTGTVSAGPTIDATKGVNGVYQIRFTDATHFTVVDPNGKQLADGQTAVAYADAGLGFTITAGGTAFVAGDGFDATVTFSTIPVPNAVFNGAGDSTGAVELLFNL